jgi:hypothetical protein
MPGPFKALLVAGFAAGLALASPAHAQDVRAMGAQDETLAESTAESVIATVTDERNRLLVRLQANAPEQTPGQINTSASELAGLMIADAMRRVLVLQPNGSPVIVGIAPQQDPDGSNRQLVLLNLSNWIAKGRQLGIEQLETFAILPDAEMQSASGSTFKLDGVGYVGAVDGGRIVFRRAP